jgi:hypothetical protein
MMRWLAIFYVACLVFMASASDAEAGPVFFAVLSAGGGFGAAFAATAFGTFLTTTITGKLLTSVAVSALQAATAKKPKAPGITTEFTLQGATNPCGFVLGLSATAGDAVCPPMTHGKAGKVPNAYLTYVIALGDVPGQSLSRVAVDGEWVTLAAETDPVLQPYGDKATGRYAGYAWFKYYDGSQTVADPMLLAKYGNYPERPWLADMIGTGVPYIIATFRFNRELYQAFPSLLVESGGIKLYDPRKDSTVGGSGPHRWGQPNTYETSRNNVVQAYNIKRGIEIPGLGIWGGQIDASALPTASWFAGMNACDVAIGTPAQPTYQAGFEVKVDMEPAAVVEELMKGCAGQIAEIGGDFKIRVGGPGLPVMFITDDDIVTTKPQDFDPFPAADQRKNGIDAKFPDPAAMWKPQSAPSRYNATWEAEDGKRRMTTMDFPACPFPDQVQRLMAAYIADQRRHRTHGIFLPPEAAVLEPLDVISWTSARNGCSGKLFDISQDTDDQLTALQRVAMREVDAGDFAWSPVQALPYSTPSSSFVPTPAQSVPSPVAAPHVILDGGLVARRPAVRISWDGAELEGVRAVDWEMRLAGSSSVTRGSTTNVAAGEVIITEGVLPSTAYEVRWEFVADWPTTWTAWLPVTTGAVGLGNADFIDGLVATLTALGVSPPVRVAALPATGNFAGRLVILTADNKIYRHAGTPSGATGWTRSADGADLLASSVTTDALGARIVTGEKAAFRSIRTENLLVSSENLISDGQLATGTFADWRPYTNPQAQFVVARNSPGVPANAPTAFVARYDMNTATSPVVTTFAGKNAFDVVGREAAAIPVTAGQPYLLSLDICQQGGAGLMGLSYVVYWLMANGTTAGPVSVFDTQAPTNWTTMSGQITPPDGAVGAWPFVYGYITSGAPGPIFWSDAIMKFMTTADLIVDGTVAARHIQAGSMSADDIRTGMLESRYMRITDLLKIDTGTGALSVGKNSAYDLDNDGAFFGRTLEAGGGSGFGFAAGKRVGGVDQYIQATQQSGLRLVNADMFVTSASAPTVTNVATSQAINLPIGSITLDVTLQGAGGGGMAGNAASQPAITPSTSGGNTVVQLWNGTTTLLQTWTATGGVAQNGQHANARGYEGQNSPLGTGGVGAPGNSGASGGAATGYGAGGGGGSGSNSRSGGDGGNAGENIVISNHSLVGIANPRLVITTGVGGNGALSNSIAGNGGAGSPGFVRYTTRAAIETRASVLPLQPTFTGTISKAAGGALTFPNLGAGFWEISAQGGNLLLDLIETHVAGNTIRLVNGAFASFISDKTPVDLATSATAVTYDYRFYKLGAWV